MNEDKVSRKMEHALSMLIELAFLLEKLGTQSANNEAAALRKMAEKISSPSFIKES